MNRLAGKVAIVTGGGRGLGRAQALALAKEGAAVVVNDLGGGFDGEGAAASPAEEVVATIVAAGGQAAVDTTDVADWDAVGGIIERAVKTFGRLDIVVNNAGISRGFCPIWDVSRRDWERTVEICLTGSAALCHWAGVHWHDKGPEAGRRIVNITSGVGLTVQPGNAMYASAKAGVAALTISCALEMAELGVRVNAVAPAGRSRISEYVTTEIMKHPEMMAPPAEGFDAMHPDRVAAVVAFMASPLCRFTGRVFGSVGDGLDLFDGWNVGRHFSNNQQQWTFEALQAALADVPLQQNGTGQMRMPNITPPDEVLQALAAIEKA